MSGQPQQQSMYGAYQQPGSYTDSSKMMGMPTPTGSDPNAGMYSAYGDTNKMANGQGGITTPIQSLPGGGTYTPPQFGLTPNYQPYQGLNNQISGAYQDQFWGQNASGQPVFGQGEGAAPTSDYNRWSQFSYPNQRGFWQSPWPSLFGNPNTWGGPVGGFGQNPTPAGGPPPGSPSTPPPGTQVISDPGPSTGQPPVHSAPGAAYPGTNTGVVPPGQKFGGGFGPPSPFDVEYNRIKTQYGTPFANNYATGEGYSSGGGDWAAKQFGGADTPEYHAFMNKYSRSGGEGSGGTPGIRVMDAMRQIDPAKYQQTLDKYNAIDQGKGYLHPNAANKAAVAKRGLL